jgi:tetratricopeptide (TPR) repeat protein
MLAGDHEEAVASGREAFRMAEQLGLDDLMAHALNNIGVSRTGLGDVAGIDDIRRSAAIAAEANASYELCRAYNNLGALLTGMGNLEEGWTARTECGRLAERFGQGIWVRWLLGADSVNAYWWGDWTESARVADQFIVDAEASSHYQTPLLLAVRARMRMARNQIEEAVRDTGKGLELSRATKDRQSLSAVLGLASFTLLEAGRAEEAGQLADEFLESMQMRGIGFEAVTLPTFAWSLVGLGRADELSEALRPKLHSRWSQAALAVAKGDFRGAADICGDMGTKADEAYARLRAAEALLADGLPVEAEDQLERAVAFYRSVGATRYLQQAEALVAADVSKTGTEPP